MDLNFEDLDSSSGCVISKSRESEYQNQVSEGPEEVRGSGLPALLSIDLSCDLEQVILICSWVFSHAEWLNSKIILILFSLSHDSLT